MSTLLILPHQLFERRWFPEGVERVVVYEHPHYFTGWKYNKKKLLLHRASMRHYFDHLRGVEKKYVEFNKKPGSVDLVFDPIDRIKLPRGLEILPSPNFLMPDYEPYRAKTKHFRFYNFYMWSKKQLDILPSIKSQDKQNRKRLPDSFKPPALPKEQKGKYIEEAGRYVNRHFADHPGTTGGFIFPINRSTALRWLRSFIKDKLDCFGPYQDAISRQHPFICHSLLSTSINIGLLQPSEIIEELRARHKRAPLNSLEGYIRQLFWREYQRYCYIYAGLRGKNYFGGRKRLDAGWWGGGVGVEPLDDCIKRGWESGYLHHIERLMVVGNYMNLSGVAPAEGFRWFMEFSCDAYEWVMEQNVLDMVFFVSGGQTMSRPYLSSSNYILRMSDYVRGEWSEHWDELYRAFVKKNRQKLWKWRRFVAL